MSQIAKLTFGKYRGYALDEVLIQDPKYFEWLRDQAGILQSKPELAAAFRELGASPDETPLHNAMQVLFLDDSTCESLADHLYPEVWPPFRAELRAQLRAEFHLNAPDHFGQYSDDRPTKERKVAEFEQKVSGIERLLASDAEIHPENSAGEYIYDYPGRTQENTRETLRERREDAIKKRSEIVTSLEARKQLLADGEELLAIFDSTDLVGLVSIDERVIEPSNGADVYLSFKFKAVTESFEPPMAAHSYRSVYLELKPSVGDEYPTILRQIDVQKRLGRRHGTDRFVVIAGRYTGIGASLAQVKTIFASQGITFLLLDEFSVEQPVLLMGAA